MKSFNKLTSDQIERLAILAEECGETVRRTTMASGRLPRSSVVVCDRLVERRLSRKAVTRL